MIGGPSDAKILDAIGDAFNALQADLHAHPYRGDKANLESMGLFCSRVERQLSVRSWRGPTLLQRLRRSKRSGDSKEKP